MSHAFTSPSQLDNERLAMYIKTYAPNTPIVCWGECWPWLTCYNVIMRDWFIPSLDPLFCDAYMPEPPYVRSTRIPFGLRHIMIICRTRKARWCQGKALPLWPRLESSRWSRPSFAPHQGQRTAHSHAVGNGRDQSRDECQATQ